MIRFLRRHALGSQKKTHYTRLHVQFMFYKTAINFIASVAGLEHANRIKLNLK